MNNGSRFIFNEDSYETHSFGNAETMIKSTKESSDELFIPKELFSLFWRHIWLILFCISLSVAGSYYFVNYHLIPVYQSSGTILISSDENSLPGSEGSSNRNGTGVGNIISRSFTLSYANPVQDALYLFKSRDFASTIADSLLGIGSFSETKNYPSLWLSFPEDSSLVSVGSLTSRIQNKLKVEPVEPTTSRSESNLLKVTIQSYSPEEASKIVNISLKVFQQKTLDLKQDVANRALSFLEEKKEETRSQLNRAENSLVNFKNENKIVAIDAQANNSVNSLSQLQLEKQNLEIQLESVNSSISNYEKQMETIKPGLADQYSKAIGPTIQNYQQRLAELRTQRFVLLSNNPQLKQNPNSEPELRRLNQQIDGLENEIQSISEGLVNENQGYIDFSGTGDGNLAAELSNIQRNLIQLRLEKNQFESQIQVLNERIEEKRAFLDTFPNNQVRLARLETDVDRHKVLLNNLISQESEIALWQQTQSSSGTIVDAASPNSNPVKPKKILWYIFAAMVGGALPLGFLFINNSLSSTIKSSEQLKVLPYPLLSVVYDHSLIKTSGWILSKSKKDKSTSVSRDIIFHHHNDTPIAESYRRIVSQILYANSNSEFQSILITSSGQGEGKTTLTANLGAAFAELDKKVLIIDCDFRRPAIYKLFSLKNSPGINEVLYNEIKLSEAIIETKISNLSVLPSGAKPNSPAKLLSSKAFKEIIKVIRPNYDIILFDTPPQGLVSDVSSLLSLIELVIVVAKFGETNENVLKHTLREIETKKQAEISLVLTNYEPKSSNDSSEVKGLHKYMYQQYYEYEKVDRKN